MSEKREKILGIIILISLVFLLTAMILFFIARLPVPAGIFFSLAIAGLGVFFQISIAYTEDDTKATLFTTVGTVIVAMIVINILAARL